MLRVALISTYELGHQSFSIASVAAWLERAGASVTCFDLAVQRLNTDEISAANAIIFHLPMHTATRIALAAIPRVRQLNPTAMLCAYGLYAPPNERRLRAQGIDLVLGAEAEAQLTNAISGALRKAGASQTDESSSNSLPRRRSSVRSRGPLSGLTRYGLVEEGPSASARFRPDNQDA